MSVGSIDFTVHPGRSVAEACEDAVRLANLLGVTIRFKINGVNCGARPGDDVLLLMANWEVALRSHASMKVAYANPLREVTR